MKMMLIILVVLVLLLAFLLVRQRQSFKHELAEISALIGLLVDHKSLPEPLPIQDTLTSKIQDQLFRLQKINRSNEEHALQQQDQLQKLIADIAHQLRTPLQNLQTYISFLEDEHLSTEQRNAYLASVRVSQVAIAFLVESFIKVSRFENNLIQLKKQETDLKGTILKALTTVHEQAQSKNIMIELEIPQEISYQHDRNWLAEAIINILDNSIKYSPEKSKILISVKQNVLLTQVSLRDFGLGIISGEENLIFQRFYRGKSITTEEGYGIGLYLARKIINQHGGTLKVKREHPGLRMIINLDNP